MEKSKKLHVDLLQSAKNRWKSLSIGRRYLRITNILFVILIAVQFIPDKIAGSQRTYLIWFSVIAEAIVLLVSTTAKNEKSLNLLLDIIGFLYGFLIVWTLTTAKLNWLNSNLFPPPGRVFAQFVEDIDVIFANIGSSLGIIAQGYLIAAVVAIPLGLILGFFVRLGSAATYVTKFLGSIPPIVYIPYGIALLPTFRSVSVLVMFLAGFWPILASTMSGVLNIDQKIIDSAKTLNVNKFTMLFSVILPAALPQIFIGCNQGLSVSFILLTSAEMIGGRNGMGYYVKYYSDFGDYTRTIVGLLIIGIVVILVTFLVNKLQQFLLRWKK